MSSTILPWGRQTNFVLCWRSQGRGPNSSLFIPPEKAHANMERGRNGMKTIQWKLFLALSSYWFYAVITIVIYSSLYSLLTLYPCLSLHFHCFPTFAHLNPLPNKSNVSFWLHYFESGFISLLSGENFSNPGIEPSNKRSQLFMTNFSDFIKLKKMALKQWIASLKRLYFINIILMVVMNSYKIINTLFALEKFMIR